MHHIMCAYIIIYICVCVSLRVFMNVLYGNNMC